MTLPEHPQARIEDLQRALEQARSDLTAFRTQVRSRIIQAHKDGDICLTGMNGGLRDLDLPEYVPGWNGTVTLTVEVCVTGTENEDTARQWAQEALVVSSHDSDVSVDDIDRDTHGFEEADEVDR
ncbi:hypothetical protein [Saccharopolyspora mangrovi]|uniref:YbaB/EbfC family DNA-binding protein n=1 Tax=Saccharopolyspora mangrovi TaxID=3082379 RepID=A0ABU6ALL9_9PSEU|nr:hypothetical protein [Saccharopolyspora sp. S2-29]MEB3372440.1 hypothetical protein [Saccharopolyspora sp. S2-29]